jgi:hypothetical protein
VSCHFGGGEDVWRLDAGCLNRTRQSLDLQRSSSSHRIRARDLEIAKKILAITTSYALAWAAVRPSRAMAAGRGARQQARVSNVVSGE